MSARTTRREARERIIKSFMDSLDRIIPPDEAAPVEGEPAARALSEDWAADQPLPHPLSRGCEKVLSCSRGSLQCGPFLSFKSQQKGAVVL
jgi:hypothetical protein